jgi:hypothetical protein
MDVTFDMLPVLAVLMVFLPSIVPGFKGWFEGLSPEGKQLFQAGVLLLITLGGVLLSVLDIQQIYGGDTWQAWVRAPFIDFFVALAMNAGVYKGTNYMANAAFKLKKSNVA